MEIIRRFEKTEISVIQELVLEDLYQDALATDCINHFEISFSQILKISNNDRTVLNINPSIPYPIFIESSGTLNENSFLFNWYFFNLLNQQPIPHSRQSYILKLPEGEYIPNIIQWEVIKLLESHRDAEVRTYDFNLSILGQLKELASSKDKDPIILFDAYLENENTFVADEIRLDFKENNDGSISILPSIEDAADEQFKKAFDLHPKVKNIYNTQIGDKRVRIIVPPKKTESLERIKKNYRKISGEQKDQVLRNPQNFFDEEEFDLDHYSKRVYDIGFYEPKFYPFIKPFSTDWVSGVTIEQQSGERSEILLEEESEFEALVNKIEAAKLTKSPSVEFKGHKIPLDDAISLKDSYIAIKEKKINKTGFRDSKGRKVLIIHDNIEELSFYEEQITSIDHILELPKRLKEEIKLLEHQKVGIAWLQSLSKSGSGALLADDMGVGKSLQVLAYLDWSIEYQQVISSDKPSLIVAPVTLLENWENEYQKFFHPFAKIHRFYGELIKSIQLDALGRKDFVLTTYETLRSKQLILGKINWFSAVLDEAQRIKTPGTLVTGAAKALNADFKIAMTGTPVENSWMDLWCITDFIASGLLGSASEFNKKYNSVLKNESVDLMALGQEIRGQLGVYIKRRIKSDILKDLPDKKALKMSREMPTIQAETYQNELDRYALNKGVNNQILITIQNLRLISDHPFLIDKEEEISDYSTQELINSSAKLSLCIKILESIRTQNEKAIVFSHFEKVQKILQRTIHAYFGIKCNIINGKTANIDTIAKASRQKLIDKFQSTQGFNIIIMSPIAAGYGLNVTGANHVIHYTRHWNPAKENQATDRVYRIGQDKPVSIYYPMATLNGKETFDQKLDKLLQMKNKLSDASLYPSEACEVKILDFQDILG